MPGFWICARCIALRLATHAASPTRPNEVVSEDQEERGSGDGAAAPCAAAKWSAPVLTLSVQLLEEAAAALEASSPLLSFSAPVGDGEATLENLVGSDNIGELAEKISLRQAIAALDETDRRIIVLRYWKGLSQSDVGRTVGMTQVMVSRREKRIISRLREELA